ncbi:rod shape-determining protein MreC [Candidatus Sumerlaeota bacterium]|nr:rod shape-determining protein MreC [Candidatus Sumerlaeota bacterium]
MRDLTLKIAALAFLLIALPGAILTWEFKRPSQAVVLRAGVGEVVAPVVRAVGWVARTMSDWLEFIVNSSQVRDRNEVLEQRLAQLKVENAFLRESLNRYLRMDATAALAESAGWNFVEAEVVAYGGRRAPHTLLLNRGSKDGIRPGAPVLHMEGLAGVVTRSGSGAATVQLLSDPRSAIGVLVLPVRAPGLVRGTGRADSLEIVLRDTGVELRPGYEVVSSGMKGSLYPRGLAVGTIGELDRNRFGQTIARVLPTVDMRRIEEVLVLEKGGSPGDVPRPWEAWDEEEPLEGEGDETTGALSPPAVPLTP